ncbi:YbaB/EbfC family nucleoid-associated protein [Rickettsiales endosymbiont of Stachyamoeba lipophora]|uniref:YbaB/EbfC family nucleoid-associated protein n=1 Tax=Rickettsiales endosymbiont of Stachyamoeba lipophora TaxID=2486578 RepID=UPI000F64CCFD|nr:YbaB/EbfC family nucleoid-associated protein [Rickettsiales endosymbiont of Stachyamoeba lipophora]AZL16226.1 YbaB/EbfC family nucleoid-associated protein [Rickettsiales endosymbiont of Stachyamoeba lipophora]
MNFGNINKLMKQAQDMQKKMTEMKEKLDQAEFEGHAGAGMVKVLLQGNGQLKKINIDPQVIDKDDTEMLEDLIVAAFNDAKNKLDQETESSSGDAFGGLNLPGGMKFPF